MEDVPLWVAQHALIMLVAFVSGVIDYFADIIAAMSTVKGTNFLLFLLVWRVWPLANKVEAKLEEKPEAYEPTAVARAWLAREESSH